MNPSLLVPSTKSTDLAPTTKVLTGAGGKLGQADADSSTESTSYFGLERIDHQYGSTAIAL